MTELEQVVCPYCGQLLLAEPGTDPRRRCRCADAVKYAATQETLEDMQALVDELFGADCNEVSKAFLPAGDNEIHQLMSLCVLVNAGLFEKASVTLADGSVCIIKGETVQRRLTVKR